MKDGSIIALARRYDALMWKQRKLINQIRESEHPNAEALASALEGECEIMAWPTHVIHLHLEHPDRYECTDRGIGRKDSKKL